MFNSFANIVFEIILWKGNGSHGVSSLLWPSTILLQNAYCSLNLLGQQQPIPFKNPQKISYQK
jgi:hypothetical protein